MKQILKYLPWAILVIGFIIFIRQCGEEPQVKYITIEKEVLVPSVEKVFDTIYEPKPYPVKVKEIDSIYYKEYVKLRDSVAKDSMFKEAIKINEYNQEFKDTLQSIKVYSKTRGTLLEQSVKYETYPYTIVVKDSVKVESKFSVSLGVELGIPTDPYSTLGPVVKGGLIFKNKRDNTFSLSYDTEGRVWVGKSWKLKLKN